MITRGSTTTRRLVTKQGHHVGFPNLSTKIPHQALHIGTKPLYHLLKPLITFFHSYNKSLLHYLPLSLTTESPKTYSLIPNK